MRYKRSDHPVQEVVAGRQDIDDIMDTAEYEARTNFQMMMIMVFCCVCVFCMVVSSSVMVYVMKG